jgi:hypothetical protein
MKTKTKTTKEKKPKKPPKVSPDIEKDLKTLKPSHIRFVYLLLGGEDGKCFNNATLAYLRAFEIETTTRKVKQDDGSEDYTSAYKSAKTNGSKLLTNANIQNLKSKLLLEVGFDPATIKKRFAELAYQNKNLPIALTATDRVAKIAGILTDDKKVDIPQLEALGNAIREILTPKK